MDSAKPSKEIAQEFDRAVSENLALLTHGISPASVIAAFADWMVHLAISPGKQNELLLKALHQSTRLGVHVLKNLNSACEPCIQPLVQDKRFRAPEWEQWPYNLLYQSFLLNQQWWHNATTDVRGVTHHHEQYVTFAVRQILDMFSPSNYFLTNPEVLNATMHSGGDNLLRGAQNRLDDGIRLLTNSPIPGTEKFRPGKEVAITPGKVIFQNQLIELIQYAPMTDKVFSSPVLIIPSWILKFYILDLSPGNSLVRFLVELGHTVFMVSWKNPDSADRELSMDDYLKSGVMAAINTVTEILPERKIQAVGYCLGGTLLAMAAAMMARLGDDRLRSLTLLASELDFTEPGELGLFIDESQLAFLDALMARQGYLDGKQMAGVFTILNSRDLMWSKMEHDYLLGKRQEITDLMAWNTDITRMPYRQHSEYLRKLYLKNDLAEGRYIVDNQPVILSDIRIPVFSLATKRDTVSPWHSVYKVHLLIDAEVTFCLTTGGHNVGIVNPPGKGVSRGYQIRTRQTATPYIDPESWLTDTYFQEGSWWPAWQSWLAKLDDTKCLPPIVGTTQHPALKEAPGSYVFLT